MERFPRKISRIEPLNLVGTARCAVRAAFSGATMPPAASRAGTSQRDVPTKVRFMESPLSFFACIGTMNRCASQRRAPDRGSATRSRFMGRKKLDVSVQLDLGNTYSVQTAKHTKYAEAETMESRMSQRGISVTRK